MGKMTLTLENGEKWPCNKVEIADICWKCKHLPEDLTKQEKRYLADVAAAYLNLIMLTNIERNSRCNELKYKKGW